MSPRHPLMRAAVVVALILCLPAGAASAAGDPFATLPQGHWAYPALESLARAGLLESNLPHTGGAALTRYEVAGLVSEAAGALSQRAASLPARAEAQVAVAWLYRAAGRFDQAAWAGGGLSPLDRLQILRLLCWLAPAANRLSAHVPLVDGEKSEAVAIRVRVQAQELYERLQEQVPAALSLEPPEEAGLALALASRLVHEHSDPAELAARIEETSQALRRLGGAFRPELVALDGEAGAPAASKASEIESHVVTLEDLRRSTGLEARADSASDGIPLAKAGDVEAWLGVEAEPETSDLQPEVNVSLDLGAASLRAGWRLIDFSGGGMPAGEGEAAFQLRF